MGGVVVLWRFPAGCKVDTISLTTDTGRTRDATIDRKHGDLPFSDRETLRPRLMFRYALSELL